MLLVKLDCIFKMEKMFGFHSNLHFPDPNHTEDQFLHKVALNLSVAECTQISFNDQFIYYHKTQTHCAGHQELNMRFTTNR